MQEPRRPLPCGAANPCAVDATVALANLDAFDAVIDARSESEFAVDHLPGACNWPTLNDAERAEVGTMYVQVHPFEARKLGAMYAARNIAAHLARDGLKLPKTWRPLVYCWRGGQRSGALALVLAQIGFRVTLIAGGYKAARAALVADTQRLAGQLHFQVVCGPTGSGKTRLLHALARAGAQVLDLEALAEHRSSVLGAMPDVHQPSQKAFETRLWAALRRFDARRWVFVESESRKVGNVSVPQALMERIRAGACIDLQLPDVARIQVLLQDYKHLTRDVQAFCDRLEPLVALRGRATVTRWQALARAGQWAQLSADLLHQHYDPLYRQSIGRNFVGYAQARPVAAADGEPATLDAAAQRVLATLEPPADEATTS